MGVPKKHKTHSSTRQRRSHHALVPRKLATCTNCKQAVLPHMACSNCGHYRGRKVAKA